VATQQETACLSACFQSGLVQHVLSAQVPNDFVWTEKLKSVFLKQIYLNIFILTAAQENPTCLHFLHSSDVLLLLLLLIAAAVITNDSRRPLKTVHERCTSPPPVTDHPCSNQA